jgi:hypothetical protein
LSCPTVGSSPVAETAGHGSGADPMTLLPQSPGGAGA